MKAQKCMLCDTLSRFCDSTNTRRAPIKTIYIKLIAFLLSRSLCSTKLLHDSLPAAAAHKHAVVNQENVMENWIVKFNLFCSFTCEIRFCFPFSARNQFQISRTFKIKRDFMLPIAFFYSFKKGEKQKSRKHMSAHEKFWQRNWLDALVSRKRTDVKVMVETCSHSEVNFNN